jgi:hypothetical protein
MPSPTGAEIAFVRTCPSWNTGDLMVVPSKGGPATRLARGLDVYLTPTELAWSADGRSIAFPHLTGPESPDDLWTADASGTRVVRVAQTAGAFAWSHHASKLA